MRESTIEAYLRDQMRALGGKAYKWSSPAQRGVPDRICIFPPSFRGIGVVFVELKATGKKASLLQQHEHEILRSLGQPVHVIDSKEGVDRFVEEMKARGGS